MANYKVPSQAGSGSDSFNDNLVGNQFTSDSTLMTGGNFAIEKVITEKDSKEFRTQPFSEFLTLDDIQEESDATIGTAYSTSAKDVKFNNDKQNADRSLYGSLKQRIGVAVTNIITKYPAGIMVDTLSPIGLNNISAENISYDVLSNTTEFNVQYSLLYNPLDIVLIEPKSNILPETDNSIRNFFSSYTKYVVDLSGTTFNIINYTEPDSDNKISLKVDGNCFNGCTGYTENYIIRPNNGIVEYFYNELDDLERVLLNRESNPKFNAGFNVPRDTNGGYTTETITEYINWPISRDEWNIQIVGLDYNYYITKLSSLSEEIDEYKSNLIIRFLTSPQLYEFDTDEKKIESIFQIYGQSFDKIKLFIDNIAYMRNISYDGINNVPDILLKNLSETLGLSTVNLFDEKTLQDSLYTRHDTQYEGVSTGPNLVEAEYEFYRRLLVNFAYLYKSKGTRTAIEFFLKFIGAPEPMIRLDEYVYKVDELLPSKTVESDIWDAIQGVKITNIATYNTGVTGTTGYTLTQITGSTTLTRDEYPVDEETGLPRGAEYLDASMYFQKGAGWYRKTLDHRSPDILDVDNSDLSSRIKVIKTKSKPFTYGEEYFDIYRNLPGLDYGFSLTSEIDNKKIEIVENENTSKLILNRKNVDVFLSADRGIDYDIYRKSRNLLLTFGTLTPQATSGITFAEFLTDITNNIVTDSHVIKYKNAYDSLSQVYNSYQQSVGFTPYNYISVSEFINRLSPYWVNIIEQFMPATTLWIGGNLIENGVFNRSKFRYRQPAAPMSYTEILYPDFETVIYEDLETIIGGGTIDGIDYSLTNFRGLQVFSGMTFNMFLNINGTVYSGETDTFKPFSGYTKGATDCTIIPSSSDYVPLFCNYGLFNGGDSISDIKTSWKSTLNNLIQQINTGNTSETGLTISIDYFLDTDGVDKAKFTITLHDYYGYRGNEVFEYYFLPIYSTGKENCTFTITPLVSGDLYFNIAGATGYPVDDGGPIDIYSGSTYSTISPVDLSKTGNCQYKIPIGDVPGTAIMMFNDGGNCEQGFTFVGTLWTGTQLFNRGLKKGTVIYKVIGTPTLDTYQDLQTAVSGGDVVEINVENTIVGDNLLTLELKSCTELTAQQFRNLPINYQFAFNYSTVLVDGVTWLSSSKTNIINPDSDEFEVLPTCQVLVYSNINVNLENVSYGFVYKYPEDIYVKPSDNSRNGDFLINQYGFPIEVTGVTLDYCRTDVYYHLLCNFATSTNILFNGILGEDNGIAVLYTESVIVPSVTPTKTPTITPTKTPTRTPTKTPTNTPSLTKSITPTITPSLSISRTPSITPSETPSITITPSVTPSFGITPSETPSETPSISITPSETPSISKTPSITPSKTIPPTPSPSPLPQSFGIYTISSYETWNDACTDDKSPTDSVWISGGYSVPTIGQYFYEDEELLTPFVGDSNWYYIKNASPVPIKWSVIITDTGYITDAVDCDNPPSPTPTPSITTSITPSISPSITVSLTPPPTPSPTKPIVQYGIHTGHTYSDWGGACADGDVPDVTVYSNNGNDPPQVGDYFYLDDEFITPFPGEIIPVWYRVVKGANHYAIKIRDTGYLENVVDCDNTPTPTPSITPSLSISRTPSITPSIPESIYFDVHDLCSAAKITNMTVGGSVPPDFVTVNPTDDVTFTSPQLAGTYSVVLTISTTGGGDVSATCVDSESTSTCNDRSGDGTITLVGIVTNSSTHISIHLNDDTCP